MTLEFPLEIRSFLSQGLLVVYSINIILAIRARFLASSKNLPANIWMIKTFLIGGIALYELGSIKNVSEKQQKSQYSNQKKKK
jgi:hypothetical protein